MCSCSGEITVNYFPMIIVCVSCNFSGDKLLIKIMMSLLATRNPGIPSSRGEGERNVSCRGEAGERSVSCSRGEGERSVGRGGKKREL